MVVLTSLIALFSPLALIATTAERQQNSNEAFLTMTILGKNMGINDYFPVDNRTISQGERLNWYVTVHNGMDRVEYISIRMKLLNSTQAIPNDILNQPSPASEIFEIRQLVARNSTWTIPLNWTIAEVSSTNDGYVTIKAMVLNGQDIANINSASLEGQGFKIVLELWRYDEEIDDFVFAWSPSSSNNIENKMRSIWTQIWFNVKN